MDKIDALGPRPDRHHAFSRELLSEAEDGTLKSIVEEAARDLGVPIALVNLVLEQVQFFKAHYGLPADLEAARGTDRDVSFCQFVVRDGQPFEVTDAENDDRVPQYLVKQYGIRAYLGIPVIANEIVVGALCVIDTKPRSFSAEDRQNLEKLAGLVNARLEAITKQTRKPGAAAGPAAASTLDQLRQTLTSMQASVGKGKMASTAIGLFLRLAEHGLNGGVMPPGAMEIMMKAAREALGDSKSSFFKIEENLTALDRAAAALEQKLPTTTGIALSEIARSGQELARQSAQAVGGILLPDLDGDDPLVAIPRPLGVALVTTCLSLIAGRLADQQLEGGIRLAARNLGGQAELVLTTTQLPHDAFPAIAAQVNRHTGEDPTVAVEAIDGAIRLLFQVVVSAG